MKITKRQLRRIIKEERRKLFEQPWKVTRIHPGPGEVQVGDAIHVDTFAVSTAPSDTLRATVEEVVEPDLLRVSYQVQSPSRSATVPVLSGGPMDWMYAAWDPGDEVWLGIDKDAGPEELGDI